MKFAKLLIFSILLVSGSEIVLGEELLPSYSFKEIKFRENSFPSKIELLLYLPETSNVHPNLVAVHGNVITNMGAEIKLLEQKNGINKLLVGLNIADCEDLMINKIDWKLSSVQGNEIKISKNQIFIPIIYFKDCMIGFSVGMDFKNDPTIQNWFKRWGKDVVPPP